MADNFINGEKFEPVAGETIKDLIEKRLGVSLTEQGYRVEGEPLAIAVAKNSQVVPRSSWCHTLAEGTIDIVGAVQGG